jgi:hypothetical protein
MEEEEKCRAETGHRSFLKRKPAGTHQNSISGISNKG